ncbi:MAG: AAA family ATPase, partial [Tepidisphaerales bacterium]
LNPTIATLDLETRSHDRIFVGQRTAQGKAMTLELSQQSEGFRRFLAHLLALYQIPSKPTLIFEEAEKGIYPGALAALADHFKSVAEQGMSQVIITTHSPQLLDHFPVDAIRVVEMEDYQTKVGPLAPEQVEAVRQNLLCAGELLTADPARTAEQV